MRPIYLFKKLMYGIKTDGIKKTINEIFFFNRTMIIIEHQISHQKKIKKTEDIELEIINKTQKSLIKNQNKQNTFLYYLKKGATCLAAFKNNKCLGYQWWTLDNQFKDLKKLSLTLKNNEAYLFNQFVFPEYRGTEIPKLIAQESFNYLTSIGITKIYGFYFSDNIKAMWWHRAFLRCREIKRIRMHRFVFFEYINGRFMLV